MRRHLLDIILLIVFAIARDSATCWQSSRASARLVLHVYVLVIGGLVMVGVVAAAGDAVPRLHRSRFDVALAEVEPEERRLPASWSGWSAR